MMVEVGRDTFVAMNVPGIDVFNSQPSASMDKIRTGTVEGGYRELASQAKRGSAAQGPHPVEMKQNQGNSGDAEDSVIESKEHLENVNVFDELQNLRIGLLTGDLSGIRDTLDRFDTIQAKLVSSRAMVGSRSQGLQNSILAGERHALTNAQLTSQLEDADMAQVVSDLAKEETVFRSTLASAQKLIQPTLLEFLK